MQPLHAIKDPKSRNRISHTFFSEINILLHLALWSDFSRPDIKHKFQLDGFNLFAQANNFILGTQLNPLLFEMSSNSAK